MFGANELCLGTQNEMPPLQQGNPRSTDPTGSCQDHDKKKAQAETVFRSGKRNRAEGIGEAMGEGKEKALNWDAHNLGG